MEKIYTQPVWFYVLKTYPEGPMKETPIKGSIDHKQPTGWFLHGSLKEKKDSMVYSRRTSA